MEGERERKSRRRKSNIRGLAGRCEILATPLLLWQIVHVRSESSEHSSECDIFCISGGKVKAGDNAFYHDIIHIPPLPPSRLDGCNIIDVDYAIKVIRPTTTRATVLIIVTLHQWLK